MDQLPGLGTVVPKIMGSTYKIYTPLLTKQAATIRSTPCETFEYGPHARHKLDLYTPFKSKDANSIFLFLYGGGFRDGDRIISGLADGLVYANLGHFFAENLGFPVAVVDYRLIRHGAKFPSGGEDIELVTEWLIRRYSSKSANPVNLYMMGNSAGGVHLATYLFSPVFNESRRKILQDDGGVVVLKGAVLLSVPSHFDHAPASMKDFLQGYFGPEIAPKTPMGLLKAAKDDGTIDDLGPLPILALTGTLDPEYILISVDDLVKEWSASPIKPTLRAAKIEGHNHISPGVSLGTDIEKEERWGWQVIDFIIAQRDGNV